MRLKNSRETMTMSEIPSFEMPPDQIAEEGLVWSGEFETGDEILVALSVEEISPLNPFPKSV